MTTASTPTTQGTNDHDLLIRIDERTSQLMKRVDAFVAVVENKAEQERLEALAKQVEGKAELVRFDQLETKVRVLEKVVWSGLGALGLAEFLLFYFKPPTP